MNGGMALAGLTSVWNSPSTSPPRTFTAPISVISQACAEPPVVSRSTTTKVVSRSGVPELVEGRLHGDAGAGARRGAGPGDRGSREGRGALASMARTVGAATDRTGAARGAATPGAAGRRLPRGLPGSSGAG